MRMPFNMRLRLISADKSDDRRFAPWFGGSILASADSFQPKWISKHEYEEYGTFVVERKCP